MLTRDGETWRRWTAGRCPCCAGDLDEWIDGTPPAPIGEGVMICGRCVAMDHMGMPGLREAMLDAIVRRTDAALETLTA